MAYVKRTLEQKILEISEDDNWQIGIIGSWNCAELVKSGKITQDMLDKSSIKA